MYTVVVRPLKLKKLPQLKSGEGMKNQAKDIAGCEGSDFWKMINNNK